MMPFNADYSGFTHQALDVCLEIKQGERVWINSWDHTVELASKLAWGCRKRGCETFLTLQPEDLWLRSIEEGPLDLVDRLSPLQSAVLKETDAYIFTLGPRAPVPWERIPADRRNAVTIWFFEQNRFVEEWKDISRRRRTRMLGIEATLATLERAQALGLDYQKWIEVMYAGCMADYHAIANLGKELASVMEGEAEARITTPDGTDFRFKLDNRPVIVSDGLATEKRAEMGEVVFLPAGCVEVSANEESAEGIVVYDIPIYSTSGTVKKLTIRAKGGRITECEALQGSEVFRKYIEDSGTDADRFASFGFGLNPNLRNGFLQDDKVLGGVTVNFGDNEAKGGKNRAHRDWWGSMTGATVEINGRVIMRNGKLLI